MYDLSFMTKILLVVGSMFTSHPCVDQSSHVGQSAFEACAKAPSPVAVSEKRQ